jgi:hypothetical protein
LPLRRVLATKKSRKVIVDEHPPPTRFASRNQAALGPAAHLFGVHLQKARSLIEGERVHRALAAGMASGSMQPEYGQADACLPMTLGRESSKSGLHGGGQSLQPDATMIKTTTA